MDHREPNLVSAEQSREKLSSSAVRSRWEPGEALQWAADMFGPCALDPGERAMRFVEEAIELAHAQGLSKDVLTKTVERVYARPAGDIAREIGQASMTLSVLAKNIGVDDVAECVKEFERVRSIPKEEWTRRHAAKTKIGITSESALAKVQP